MQGFTPQEGISVLRAVHMLELVSRCRINHLETVLWSSGSAQQSVGVVRTVGSHWDFAGRHSASKD